MISVVRVKETKVNFYITVSKCLPLVATFYTTSVMLDLKMEKWMKISVLTVSTRRTKYQQATRIILLLIVIINKYIRTLKMDTKIV